MLFSVIIPTYNRALFLREALNSVFAQAFTDYEVIVVDDGSTDGTAEFVRGLGGRVQLVTQTNLGPGAGRNNGARHARGEYLSFLDSDDLWFPWTLACFAELIQRHDRPAILAAKLVSFADETELAMVRVEPLQADVFPDYFASHRSGYFVGAGMSVLRRADFLVTGGYTDLPINGEDHDLILRMGTAKGFVQVKAPVTVGWRRHSGSVTFDTKRSTAGDLYLIAQEREGAYPGGAARARQRRAIITRHVRPNALGCLRDGRTADGWRLYRETFGWHLRQGRLKFLAGFPLKALFR